MNWVAQRLRGLTRFVAEPPPQPRVPSPGFDRFSIAFLCLDWIVFGSMHFSLHGATVRMLPDWVPFPDFAVVGTGIAEVSTGVLMLYGRARRIAAIVSLLLLVLLIPAVVHILQVNDALPFPPQSLPSRAWRLLGVPHNVLLAICSLHVLRKPYPDGWSAAEPRRAVGASLPGDRDWAALMVAFILLLCNAAGFLSILLGVHGDKPTAAMWMMMCLSVGALLGFLFAVPRANKKARTSTILVPNRNIEAISDWLTKILVGLGLVNFKDIGDVPGRALDDPGAHSQCRFEFCACDDRVFRRGGFPGGISADAHVSAAAFRGNGPRRPRRAQGLALPDQVAGASRKPAKRLRQAHGPPRTGGGSV